MEFPFRSRVLFALYALLLVSLFLYSYTQIDLGLVITRIPSLYSIEKHFQYIGYFNRSLSTTLFILLVLLLSVFYLYFLRQFHRKQLTKRFFWSLVGVTAVVLAFSYNALSYDLFNYIFDAKILTHYHLNPYQYMALNFPQDPMLGFMHWTNRTYPYGPIWLGLTVPLSFVGANIFIITFYLFKILIVGSYVGTVYFLSKIVEKVKFENPLYLTALFAFNPLVIMECCVSAHNDIVMLFFAIWSVYLLFEKKYLLAFILLFLSIGIKFATIFLLPIFIYVLWRRNTLHWEKLFIFLFLLMLIPLFFVIMRTNFQPWYLLYILVFVPLLPKYKKLQQGVLIISIISLAVYIPFLFLGNWNTPWFTVQTIIYYWLSVVALAVGIGYMLKLLFIDSSFRKQRSI